MYLKGLSGAVLDVRMPDGSFKSFSSYAGNSELFQSLKAGGQPTIGPAREFGGGWLVNDCPLNVIFEGNWLPGQQEALRAAGITRCLPLQQAPVSSPLPVLSQIAAPGWTAPPTTKSGARIMRGGGIETATAPRILIQEGGPSYWEPADVPMPEAAPPPVELADFGAMGGIAAGVAVALIVSALTKRR